MRHHVEQGIKELFLYGVIAMALSGVTVAGFRGVSWVIGHALGII